MVVVVEVVVIAMALLQRRPAQDTQVHQEAEVEDSLAEGVVEATATVLLLRLQAPLILHRPVPAQVLTQPQHQVQAPLTDLRQEVAVACLAMEVVAVAVVVAVVMVEGEESRAPRCRRRAVSKFLNKSQFR